MMPGVPRFRLRYQSTNLEMPLGEFSIGRSSSCNLALADGLVSRKHAVLHVGPDAVVVEDLGSRNGVAVNGVRINGPRRVAHMDRVYIGSQELVLIDAAKLRDGAICGVRVLWRDQRARQAPLRRMRQATHLDRRRDHCKRDQRRGLVIACVGCRRHTYGTRARRDCGYREQSDRHGPL
ncbi:MAG: FHA domain-containing protein, partial [Deltaproteobacteria bacterium]